MIQKHTHTYIYILIFTKQTQMKLDLFRRASVSFNPDVYFSAVVWPTHFKQKMVGRFSDNLLSSRSRPVQPMLQFASKKLNFSILILESHPCRVYYNMHIQDLFHKSKMTTKMKDVLDGMRSALDSIHQSLDLRSKSKNHQNHQPSAELWRFQSPMKYW